MKNKSIVSAGIKLFFPVILIFFSSCVSPKVTEERVKEFKEETYNYELNSNDTLLDVGCGNGFVDGCISSAYPNMYFVLEDVHKLNCFILYSNFQRTNPDKTTREIKNQIKTVRGKEDTIPLADHSFSKILCRLSLHEFQNKPKMVEELKRLLKDDGSLIIVEELSTFKGQREQACNKLLLSGNEITELFASSGLSLKCYNQCNWKDSIAAAVFLFVKKPI